VNKRAPFFSSLILAGEARNRGEVMLTEAGAQATDKKIRVLVVDDSALMRHVLSEILNSDPDIEVVGTASDPYFAREKIKQLNPDVLTLDVEMPKMDGLQFLRNLMRLRPMPVVMVSSLTQRGAGVTLEALELGAVDFVSKPEIDIAEKLRTYTDEIVRKVKIASVAKVSRLTEAAERAPNRRNVIKPPGGNLHFKTTDRILAIGASTGGTEAIRVVLEKLPADTPGTVIVQHIPGMFSSSFANRMNDCSEMTVTQAEDGQRILHGHVYIAPGDRHLTVKRDGARYYCCLSDPDAEPVSGHKPSVDALFHSVADQIGHNAIGVILTGMGKDGAEGMLAMKNAGAKTMVQDEASSVVWGMPGAAAKLGASDEILPLTKIAPRISLLFKRSEQA
jgi:two-component system, chemotaxis family, protein-glutamate methylesterase/glutaminase